jgi:hypothetical protein
VPHVLLSRGHDEFLRASAAEVYVLTSQPVRSHHGPAVVVSTGEERHAGPFVSTHLLDQEVVGVDAAPVFLFDRVLCSNESGRARPRIVVPDARVTLLRRHVGDHDTHVEVTRHERAIREGGTAVHPHSDEVIGEDPDDRLAKLKTGLGGRGRQFVE